MECPACHTLLVKHGIRKNKKTPRQVFQCRNCRLFSTEYTIIPSHYPLKTIEEAFALLCQGKSYQQIGKALGVSTSTIFRWVNKIP